MTCYYEFNVENYDTMSAYVQISIPVRFGIQTPETWNINEFKLLFIDCAATAKIE